jgi:GNAT superfamily N-acetyltransferase
MFAVERNATGVDAAWLQGLSRCFPGAWDEASYRWYLKRRFRSREPDTLTAFAGSAVIGGIGINYRQLCSPAGVHEVGVLTAAWTLPEYQGRGCFRVLVQRAIEAAAEKGCEALLSFVTVRSASALRLYRMGAVAVPTWYLFLSPEDSLLVPGELPIVHALRTEGLADLPPTDSRIAFHYTDPEEWTAQFVDRPHRTTMFKIEAGVAVLEHVGRTDRLQFLYPPSGREATTLMAMASRARAEERRFFFFTTDGALAERATALGLRQTAGAIMVLELGNGRGEKGPGARSGSMSWTAARWHVQPGDRM